MTTKTTVESPILELEGYHTVTQERDEDIDHGPCTGYVLEGLGITVFVYDDHPDMLSVHIE